MARLFVAVWPPPDVLDALERFDRPVSAGTRWTTREQWHVTLRFVGRADPAAAAAALGAIAAPCASAEIGPTVVELGPVVVAPVAGLDELAAAVRTATAEIGEPPDPRPFSGHLTLARGKELERCPMIGASVEGRFTVTEIALVASETHPDGARYTDVARFPLEDP